VVKAVGSNGLCVSGGCDVLTENASCGMNKKCVYSKGKCVVNVCEGSTRNDCEKKVICYIDNVGSCVFDSCTEGSGMNDKGAICSSLAGCGYEKYDDTCRIATSKFSSIVVGSVLGIV
jgi:hypothetical protein